MIIKDLISNRDDFIDLCKNHSVKQIYAFGSSVSENFDQEKSDIDLLVEIDESDPVERGEKILLLWDNLELFFNRKVDLLTNPVIRNPYLRKNIEDSKVLIYDASSFYDNPETEYNYE
jgi:predicted nucleotidyltransferase